MSARDEWDWLVNHGEFKHRKVIGRALRDDPTAVWFEPFPARRGELQAIAKSVFDDAATVTEKAQTKVVRDYVSHFPEVAFDPNSWFWNHYWIWRARRNQEDQRFLNAVARGVRAYAPGSMSKHRFKATLVKSAKQYRDQLKQKTEWKELFDLGIRESRSHDRSVATRAVRDYLLPLIRQIETETGYRSDVKEIQDKGLGVVRLKAVARKYSTPKVKVSETDLH